MERTGDSANYFLYHVNFLINQKEIASEQIKKRYNEEFDPGSG